MASNYEISDDDDSFNDPVCVKSVNNDDFKDIIPISSDEDEAGKSAVKNEDSLLSDDEDIPKVVMKKNNAIKNLFSSKNPKKDVKIPSQRTSNMKEYFSQFKKTNDTKLPAQSVEEKKPEIIKMIAGVKVTLPVNPYGSQIALMAKIITGIKKSENCILESPTGSGKTLALLCGALAWQQHEQNILSQNQAQQYFNQFPDINKDGVKDYIATPQSKKTDVTPEKLFSKPQFGEKSIYERQEKDDEASCSTAKRQGPYKAGSEEESSSEGLVSIHKRRRVGSMEYEDGVHTPTKSTPEKTRPDVEDKETPEKVSLPTIYYGARTHTQLKQVIKEFRRTSYCGVAKMSILSSRDKSCVREFSRDQWSSRNDMCRACVKPYTQSKAQRGTGCQYYDNRNNLTHGNLPSSFDLEELIEIGRERDACPYYGARHMAKTAHIVFCPYNYLIDPNIRSSLSINLQNNIVIIDEAHNIESICRDAASVSITRTQIQNALKELEKVAEYRYATEDGTNLDALIHILKNWDYWFENQLPLVNKQSVNNNEAIHEWDAEEFVKTLDNHNIGPKHYGDFKSNTEIFCRRLREDPRTLFGVTQATGTMMESFNMGLGYLFRSDCQHVDDFKPVLIRQVAGKTSQLAANGWRNSQFREWVSKEQLTLSLMCSNPAIVMSGLAPARCVTLASGTLTPLGSLHAELDTPFPHNVAPAHVVPKHRVWIGTLTGDASGGQQYTNAGLATARAPRVLGEGVVRVCELTPGGVLCFLPSYAALDKLCNTWREIGIWQRLEQLKYVLSEKRNDKEHEETMNEFYECVTSTKGALLFAVYRGKVSEGMDFKDQQARAVICVGVPYPNTFDPGVRAKKEYNDRHCARGLLPGREWLRVQAYRALNQAVGRCVRHVRDWGAVLLADERYRQHYYTEHLSKWVKLFLGNNHHTLESLTTSPEGLAAFMERMKILEEEEELGNMEL